MRRWARIAAAALVLAAAGCGGGDEQQAAKARATTAPKPAASPEQFAERFERLTTVELEPVPDPFGVRMDEPGEPDLGYRFSGYTYYWTGDDSDRELLLDDGRPDAEGVLWEPVGDGWAASKAYGPRLVLDWVGGDEKGGGPEWARLDRLTEAAYTGRTDVLRPEERPCESVGIDPLRGRTGTCSVGGIPVTSADARDGLRTPGLEARVVGLEVTDAIKPPGAGLQPLQSRGRYVVLAYRVRNSGERPIRFVESALRIGDATFGEDATAFAYLPRVGTFPIEPGRALEQRVAFDVPPGAADRLRRDGALVLPAATDELGDPNIAFAQAWLRLADVPSPLPAPPVPEQPGLPPPPQGPPDIAVERGSGPPIGGTTRRLYTANTIFPMPQDFVPGGVNAGTRAGECKVPRVDRRVRTTLLAAIKRDTPRAKGRVAGLADRQILLADCGPAGDWAMLSWIARGPKGPTIFVDEFELRGGAWHGSPKGRRPGCGLPDAAAAAWRIDISHCDWPGDGPPGSLS